MAGGTHLVMPGARGMVRVPHSPPPPLLPVASAHGTLRTASARILPRLSEHVAVRILPHLGTGVVIGVGGNRRLSSTWECRRPAPRGDAVHPTLVYGFVTLEKKKKKKEEAGRVFLSPTATVSLPRKRKLGVHFLSTLPPAALWEERQQPPRLVASSKINKHEVQNV